jgi:hypothetical protein
MPMSGITEGKTLTSQEVGVFLFDKPYIQCDNMRTINNNKRIKTPVNLLKTIINQMGYVDAEQCQELACYFPNAELIIQWGYLPREACRAAGVAHRIKEGENLQGDYVRSVWFASEALRKLKGVLGVIK